MTPIEFVMKAEYEGGVTEALEHGLRSKDIEVEADDDLGRLLKIRWSEIEQVWSRFEVQMNEIQSICDDIYERDEEEE